jgi:hypothetical protein
LSKSLAVIAALAALALVIAGCGDSDDSTTDSTASLTKAEFVKQGNAICAAGNKELDEGFGEFAEENNLSQKKEPTQEQFEEVAEDVLIPGISNQIDKLRALGTPEGDEGEVDQILTGAEEALEEIEDDPALASEEDNGPFGDVNKEAREYGLTTCGEE